MHIIHYSYYIYIFHQINVDNLRIYNMMQFSLGEEQQMVCAYSLNINTHLVLQGTFEHNVFQGHGVLEWSVKASCAECIG